LQEKNRYGTEKDRKALSDLFKDFGFEVEHHDNLKAQQLCDEINKLAERDEFQEYACLVVCILSHGDEGTVCGTDSKEVSIEEAKKQFFNNTYLRGKPKIWIIQACQGNLSQEDLEKSTLSLKLKETTPDPTTQNNLPNTGIHLLFL
jgi:caspase 2